MRNPDPSERSAPTPTPPDAPARQVDLQFALMLGAVMLAVYLRTLAPDLLPGDPGEFQTAAWTWGLAHPTGYPLYLLIGGLWQRLLAWLVTPAAALNGLSALLGAGAVALAYLVSVRAYAALLPAAPATTRQLAAVYSALLLGVNLTFWSQALIAEVYTLHMVLMLAIALAAQAVTEEEGPVRAGPLLRLAALSGLALAHHALTLLWLPFVALYVVWTGRGRRQVRGITWAGIATALAAPLLLYLYIPLRSGPGPSPWYHQRLGDGVLTLYGGGWEAFWAFLSGSSISVGFRDLAGAWGQLPLAGWLWHYHLGWLGLAMVGAGLFWLVRRRAWPLLGLTLGYALAHQTFVLFYAIGDILVYYIPLYWVGALWAGCGLLGLATGVWTARPAAPVRVPPAVGWLVAGGLLLWSLRGATLTGAAIDQSGSRTARTAWEAILAAPPPADALLVSNDRNEIVPLFYLQAVEGRGTGLTGLFPLIAPDARFADLGATLDTALAAGGDQPVYLIKPMPGLEVKYQLTPGPPPLVQVTGPVAVAPGAATDIPFGPLRLVGYTADQDAAGLTVRLHWQVDAPVGGDYTATVQLLDAAGGKLAQDDHPAGGVYYPTSLWKPGETLVETHRLQPAVPLPAGATLLVGMYRGPEFARLAPTVTLPLQVEMQAEAARP